ncbi:hypothetical protein Q8F57_003085 [Paraburkholderia terrae]|uniref:hypothetical protein n=1 Tax=Paraburkholderia terrae TaxID=311230 RepID=UPI00296ACC41|nr:hypothetical protein [Paraburkholderia terrae]MDW3655491.1 hypothetical protein [Paraburkholderia terrae]
MMRFNVRVELLGGANREDYENLHTRLLLNGYVTFIVDNAGQQWQLPPAEYVHASGLPLKAIRDHASAVVARGLRLGLGYRLYVVSFTDWASMNLLPDTGLLR